MKFGRFAGGLALGVLAGALTACQPEPTTGHSVALLYGITNYGAPSKIKNLQFPALDVEALGPLLKASSGGVFDSVVARTDAAATKAQLRVDLAAAATVLGPDDEFLFYYSGHGAQGVEANFPGTDGHALIVPYGIVPEGGSVPAYSAASMVNEDELRAWLSALPTKKVVVVLDSCYSGGFLLTPSGSDGVPQDSGAYYAELWQRFLEGKAPTAGTELTSWYKETATDQTAALASWKKALAGGSGFSGDQAQVLTAAGALEESYDDETSRHGAFTHWLLEAKTKGDFDGSGYVTVSEAYRCAFEGLQGEWNGIWGAVGRGDFGESPSVFLPHLSQGPVDYLLFRK